MSAYASSQPQLSDESAPDKEINDPADKNNISSQFLSVSEQKVDTEKLISFDLTFRDTGCGISAENQQKLFKNFGKIQETEKINSTGVGLGLSICREIIYSQGGTINIFSEEGKGSDFVITLQTRCRVDENELNQAVQIIAERGYLSKDPINTSAEESSQQSEAY